MAPDISDRQIVGLLRGRYTASFVETSFCSTGMGLKGEGNA